MPSSPTDAVRLGRAEDLVCVDEREELDAGAPVAARLGRAEELVQVVNDEGGECDAVFPDRQQCAWGELKIWSASMSAKGWMLAPLSLRASGALKSSYK